MKITTTTEKFVEVREDEPIDIYHSNYDYLSSTALKHGLRSMRELRWFLDGKLPRKESDAFEIGKAFELALLEHEKVESEIAVLNEDNRPEPTKTMASKLNSSWKKQFELDNEEKIIISKDNWGMIEQMVRGVAENTTLDSMIGLCSSQVSIYWQDEETGVKLKTRPDLVLPEAGLVIDIKTAPDGSPSGFGRQVQNFSYWLQAIMQIDGLERAGMIDTSHPENFNYFWLVSEKQPPYNATLYEFDKLSLSQKYAEYRALLDKVMLAQKTDHWGGYENPLHKYGVVDLKVF